MAHNLRLSEKTGLPDEKLVMKAFRNMNRIKADEPEKNMKYQIKRDFQTRIIQREAAAKAAAAKRKMNPDPLDLKRALTKVVELKKEIMKVDLKPKKKKEWAGITLNEQTKSKLPLRLIPKVIETEKNGNTTPYRNISPTAYTKKNIMFPLTQSNSMSNTHRTADNLSDIRDMSRSHTKLRDSMTSLPQIHKWQTREEKMRATSYSSVKKQVN